jgi:hypothetical protein
MHILRTIIDAANPHSELNNSCSGLISGLIYMVIIAATILYFAPPLLHRMFS